MLPSRRTTSGGTLGRCGMPTTGTAWRGQPEAALAGAVTGELPSSQAAPYRYDAAVPVPIPRRRARPMRPRLRSGNPCTSSGHGLWKPSAEVTEWILDGPL